MGVNIKMLFLVINYENFICRLSDRFDLLLDFWTAAKLRDRLPGGNDAEIEIHG